MRFTELNLAGFKSFAHTTLLHFPAPITAIVGPNGSGKSNVAEAVRWVLGEQSMKTLRGRKGEDFIFNGSGSSARLGKAAVGLTFDNRDHGLPLDFDAVMLERKIFRDGTNEYFINDSRVRLKDIAELLARMGLGQTHHNIISQGEVDHILLTSPRERRQLLEEAMGLHIYQLKKRDAQKKLEETERNMQHVAGLVKEISPHVKFLKTQAEKAERRTAIQQQLDENLHAYLTHERTAMRHERDRLDQLMNPTTLKLKTLEKKSAELAKKIEGIPPEDDSPEAWKTQEKKLDALEAHRAHLERELGRIEGRLELATTPHRRTAHQVEIAIIETTIRPMIHELKTAHDLDDIAALKERVSRVAEKLAEMMAKLTRTADVSDREVDQAAELKNERLALQAELKRLADEGSRLKRYLAARRDNITSLRGSLQNQWRELRDCEEKTNATRIALERLLFEQERLNLRQGELERFRELYAFGRDIVPNQKHAADNSSVLAPTPEELKRKVERLHARLEDIGGIDPAMLREYHETKKRYEFLERELTDLKTAKQDLGKLIAELDRQIERDFKIGFANINKEFQHYFYIIFNGGQAQMTSQSLKGVAEAEMKEEDSDPSVPLPEKIEYGVGIDVALPRKRIKGLAMLSGGERALVSIALLFAIAVVNPPPFLILDETDAALDEANSQKYAAILKELAKKTQLIVITHNRETMKQAEVLYGVTMGEDGISKIFSLKLEEAENYGNH